ncbi:MAG: putative peptidoglycan glycosyltransferase FtsW [Selenomonadaceae bacterium]|nr:putative peptidoglycan glycosyltransferase FtsW [Selenomonadaceae bacterium]
MNPSETTDAAADVASRPSRLVRKKLWQNDMEAVLGIMAVLLILGMVNVLSSSFVIAETRFDDPYFFLKRHLISLVLGITVCIICARVDYHVWRRFMPIVYLVTFVALILVFFIGPEVNGARRWLPLPMMQVQPAEGAKIVAIMMMAASMAARCYGGRKVGLKEAILNPQIFLIAILAALVFKEPDMGTAAVILGVPVVLFLVTAQLPKTQLFGTIAVIAAGVAGFIMEQPYRIERMKMMWDPWQDAQNVGYQTVQSLSTVGSGKLLGMGLGVGISKYDYLPEGHTDFAFAIFCQENGYLGALAVFLLYTALLVYGVRIANKASDTYGQLLSFGIVVLIVGQGICNMLMVGGAFPVVGVPLPFISYGGSSLIFTMLAIGILINIGRIGERDAILREQEQYEEELQATAPKPHIGLRLVKTDGKKAEKSGTGRRRRNRK